LLRAHPCAAGWEIRASIVRKLAQPESSREENFDAEPITEDDAA
jgi:hypothetical protein